MKITAKAVGIGMFLFLIFMLGVLPISMIWYQDGPQAIMWSRCWISLVPSTLIGFFAWYSLKDELK